ncbi:unnamed protein product [Oikopleura dioica]|uniref:Uncharacterized protein n=1 Tax=Oikopleura dioica TaxID=34765 RepID=E4Y8I7_OIKDI|nr:unnamed protein product [Oikopleura dioica]
MGRWSDEEIRPIEEESRPEIIKASNPGFGFHDDILPGFTKNAVAQPKFGQGAFDFVRPFPITIVPDNNFASLEAFDHISTFEIDFNSFRDITFDLKLAAESASGKIMEFRFATNQLLMGFEAFTNGSYGIISSFFDDPIILDISFFSSEWSTIEISIKDSEVYKEFFDLEITKLINWYNETNGLTTPRVPTHTASRNISKQLLRVSKNRIRILKFNHETMLKKFFYFKKEPSQLLVILSNYMGETHRDITYGFIGDGTKRAVELTSSVSTQHRYTYTAVHAVVKNQLHIFGGHFNSRKVARLDDCKFVELPITLFNDYESMISAALSIDGGSSALICFDIDSEKNCEIFDGATNTKASSTAWNHIQGGLGHYKGLPVSVGGELSNKAEMLTEEGWIDLPDHPAVFEIGSHSLVGLPSGSLLLLCGFVDRWLEQSWRLTDNVWTQLVDLEPTSTTTSIQIDSSVYVFSGQFGMNYPIQRIDLEGDEIIGTTVVCFHEFKQWYPILFLTTRDYCAPEFLPF